MCAAVLAWRATESNREWNLAQRVPATKAEFSTGFCFRPACPDRCRKAQCGAGEGPLMFRRAIVTVLLVSGFYTDAQLFRLPSA